MRSPLYLRPIACALCLAAVLGLTGCSFLIVKRLPADHVAGDSPDCTSSLGPALADSLFTVLWGVGAVALFRAADDPDNSETTFGSLGVGASVAGVGHLVGAAYGAVHRNRCKAALAASPVEDPNRYRPDRPGPGTLGGQCLDDGTCDGILECDRPMNTCIQPSDD